MGTKRQEKAAQHNMGCPNDTNGDGDCGRPMCPICGVNAPKKHDTDYWRSQGFRFDHHFADPYPHSLWINKETRQRLRLCDDGRVFMTDNAGCYHNVEGGYKEEPTVLQMANVIG